MRVNLQLSLNKILRFFISVFPFGYGSLDYTIGQEDIIHSTELPDGRKDYTQKDFAPSVVRGGIIYKRGEFAAMQRCVDVI